MPVLIPDEYLEIVEMDEQELKLEISLFLYQKGKISLGKAAQLAGVNRFAFQREMAKRKIPINFTIEDLEKELHNLGAI